MIMLASTLSSSGSISSSTNSMNLSSSVFNCSWSVHCKENKDSIGSLMIPKNIGETTGTTVVVTVEVGGGDEGGGGIVELSRSNVKVSSV